MRHTYVLNRLLETWKGHRDQTMVSPDGIKLDEWKMPVQLISAVLHPKEMTMTY